MAFRASAIGFIRLQPVILPSEDISTMIVYDKGVTASLRLYMWLR